MSDSTTRMFQSFLPETKLTWPTLGERFTWRTWEIGWIRISNKTSNQRQQTDGWKGEKNTWVVLTKHWLFFYSSLGLRDLNYYIYLPLFRINVLECSALDSYNILNIFKSFLSLSKIDFGVLNAAETERWDIIIQYINTQSQ